MSWKYDSGHPGGGGTGQCLERSITSGVPVMSSFLTWVWWLEVFKEEGLSPGRKCEHRVYVSPWTVPQSKKNQRLYVLERRGLLWFCQSGLHLVLWIGHNESMDVCGCVGKSHCSSAGKGSFLLHWVTLTEVIQTLGCSSAWLVCCSTSTYQLIYQSHLSALVC